MDHFAGLDVSVKETSVCIVDDTGKIVREVKVASEPEALLAVLRDPVSPLPADWIGSRATVTKVPPASSAPCLRGNVAQLRSQGGHGGDGEVRDTHQRIGRELARAGCAGRTAACRPAGASRAARHLLHRRLLAIVRDDEVCQRLMTTPGVGPVVALTYRATVDVPARFRKSKSVGAVFGLMCSKYQSGEIDRSGRISRCGDEMMRVMLYEAAQSMCIKMSLRPGRCRLPGVAGRKRRLWRWRVGWP